MMYCPLTKQACPTTNAECAWWSDQDGQCSILIRDPDVFPLEMRFSDPRREAASYPRFTPDELREFARKTPVMQDRILEVKKITPAIIEMEEKRNDVLSFD